MKNKNIVQKNSPFDFQHTNNLQIATFTSNKSSLRSEAALLTRFGNIMYVTSVIITFLFCAFNGVVGDIAECWILQQFGSVSTSFSTWVSVIFCLIGGFLGFLTFLVGRIFCFAAETLLHEAKRLHKEG